MERKHTTSKNKNLHQAPTPHYPSSKNETLHIRKFDYYYQSISNESVFHWHRSNLWSVVPTKKLDYKFDDGWFSNDYIDD